MKFLSSLHVFHFPLPNFPTHHKLSDFFPISRLGGDHFRIIISESHLIEDSQKKKKTAIGNTNSCLAEMKL